MLLRWWCVQAVTLYFRNEPRKHDPIYDDDDEEEEILGSDDDEQEDPKDYCKGI